MHHIRAPRHTTTRIIYRFLAGRPLDGRARTDATWLHRGTRALTPHGRATAWAMLPGWRRQIVRHGATATATAATYGYLAAPELTATVGTGTGTVAAAYATVRARRAIRTRQVHRRYVRPLSAVLAGLLGQPADRPTAWLHVPAEITGPAWPTLADRVSLPAWLHTPAVLRRLARSWRTWRGRPDAGTAEGWVRYPAGLLVTPELRRTVAQVLLGKLGTDELNITWHEVGAHPTITYRTVPRPPASVDLADIIDVVHAAPDAAPIIGIGAGGKAVSVDLDTDSPHWAASCGSGAGKSVLLRGLIAQWLHHGVQVLVLDGKRVSQSWCKDLPGVQYCRTGEEMHHALTALAGEVTRRFDVLDSVPADQEHTVDVGPRVVCVFEEQNVGMQMLAEYWQLTRTSGQPKRSPAMSALDHILCAGRQARVHVVSVAQMFTVAACGGNPAARENYGTRIMARASRNAWVMLAPEAAPFPRSSKRRGRMHVVVAGEPTEVQVAFWSVAQAQEWATNGATPGVPVTFTAAAESGSDLCHSAAGVTHDRLVTLADAARQGIVPMAYGTLRNAKSAAGDDFPAGVTVGGVTKYRAAELAAWADTRPARVPRARSAT